MTNDLEAVVPARPVAGYVGGKRALSKTLCSMIEATPHELYGEAFVGMGGIFFRRRLRPKVEVINDVSSDVATLFRILQRHYQAFLDMLKWQIVSRSEFDRLLRTDPSTLTDLERAARFLYLQKTAFGGKVTGRSFGVMRTSPARFDLTKLVPMLEEAHERLCGVTIEKLPYDRFLQRWDRPGALFYLDPPYWGCEDDYGKDVFSPADFGRLRDLLGTLKGRWILSINDVPEIRELFAHCHIEPVGLKYRVSGGVTDARELIISGENANG